MCAVQRFPVLWRRVVLDVHAAQVAGSRERAFAGDLAVLEIELAFDIAHTPRAIIEQALKAWRERRHQR